MKNKINKYFKSKNSIRKNDIWGNNIRGNDIQKNNIRKKIGLNGMKKEAGIDGILVTVGLCVIALLLCVVMKDSLAKFITTIINELTLQAKNILSGTVA